MDSKEDLDYINIKLTPEKSAVETMNEQKDDQDFNQ